MKTRNNFTKSFCLSSIFLHWCSAEKCWPQKAELIVFRTLLARGLWRNYYATRHLSWRPFGPAWLCPLSFSPFLTFHLDQFDVQQSQCRLDIFWFLFRTTVNLLAPVHTFFSVIFTEPLLLYFIHWHIMNFELWTSFQNSQRSFWTSDCFPL